MFNCTLEVRPAFTVVLTPPKAAAVEADATKHTNVATPENFIVSN
jgi:hypothetical protein